MVLYGASGHCKVVIDILESMGIPIDYIVDDDPNVNELLGFDVRRDVGEYDELIVTIGSPKARKKIVESTKVKSYGTVVHPSAIVSPRATIGEGTVVIPGAIINSCAKVGKHCIINTGSTLEHDVVLGDFVHVAPHATVTGAVTVGEGTWIGAGAVVRQGIHIGKWCMIGAGAVVVKDVPDGVTVVGNPARVIKL
ncbi:MAG: acetyltransferase [Prevotellaceae bacterium]|nr:acetyltransferase [Prevotellaceae bacterium]